MSFNKKRLPELSILIKNHMENGDTYLEQFKSSDALIGSFDSMKYLDDYFKSNNEGNVDYLEEITSLLIKASDILFKKASSKYSKDLENLQKVINSITNKQ